MAEHRLREQLVPAGCAVGRSHTIATAPIPSLKLCNLSMAQRAMFGVEIVGHMGHDDGERGLVVRSMRRSGLLAAIALRPAGARRPALVGAMALLPAMALSIVGGVIAVALPSRAIARPAYEVSGAFTGAELGRDRDRGEEDRGEDVRAREAWFYGQRAFPRSSIPRRAYLRARRQAAKLPRFPLRKADKGPGSPGSPRQAGSKSFAWTRIGPRPIASRAPLYDAGRVTALAVQDTKTVYAGAANGGVWKTTTGGLNWTAVFDKQPSLAIGAVAIDPNNSDTVLVGTGEGNFSFDSYAGAGLFRSSDAGASWSNISGPGGSRFDSCSISDIVVKPKKSSTIGVGVVGSGVPGPSACNPDRQGVHVSTDGGKTWALKAPTPGGKFDLTGAFDLAIAPANPDTWFAGMANGAVWRSKDSGQNWDRVLVAPGGARTSIAVAPAKPHLIVAAVEFPAKGNTKETVDLYLSSNGGTTWNNTQLPMPRRVTNHLCSWPANEPRQCWYDLALTFDPTAPRVFYLGGVLLYRYEGLTGGGWGVRQAAADTHVDNHALAHDPTGNLWIGSDGGVNTLRWIQSPAGRPIEIIRGKSEHLPISEFQPGVSGNVDQLIGGTQDNGTVLHTGVLQWDRIHGGDGGFTASDPTRRRTMYTTEPNFKLWRSTNGGTSWRIITPLHGDDQGLFYSPLVNEPGAPRTIYAGSHRLWRSVNRGDSWRGVSPGFDNAISAIGTGTTTPASPNTTAYVGFGRLKNDTGPGGIRFSANITSPAPTWIAARLPPTSPGGPPSPFPTRWVTDFWINPSNSKEAFAALSGFGTAHVFHTTNGVDWVNADGSGFTGIPNTPVNALAVDISGAFPILYAGTDVGVFASGDEGANWVNASTDLPGTAVVDLLVDHRSNPSRDTLIAATHGRGAYTAQLSQAPPFSDITMPSTVSGPLVARFAVPVKGVTSSNFVLRVDATPPPPYLPASLLCKNAAGSTVDCVSGKVSVAELMPSSTLTAGQKYVAIVNPNTAPTKIQDSSGTEVPLTSQTFQAS
jgi:hypothetical protein